MADEATVMSHLSIQKRDATTGRVTLEFQSRPGAFTADVTGSKGPTPGALTIPVGGKVVSLEELATPGLCFVSNNDATNYVELGIYDPQTDIFYPLLEWLPGEGYAVRLSRKLLEEYSSTGTGTTGPTNRMFMKADGADVNVFVGAFEK